MAQRTTVENVRSELSAQGSDIPSVEVLDDLQIQAVGIDPAVLEVDERLAGEGMSDARLEQIERCLAAHFILSSGIDEVRQLDSESLDDGSSYSYARPSTREGGYDETSAGRKAIALDESGQLAGANGIPNYTVTIEDV